MALETGTFIDSLNANNPAITDQIDQGDDHIRLLKSTIKSTFPSITGAVTLTHAQINALETRMGTAETNITTLDAAVVSNDNDLATLDAGKANIAGDTFTGDVIIQGSTTLATATATTPTDLTDSSTNIATTSFVQQNIATLDPLPSGMISPFAGAAAPTGWLLCDGSAVSRTTYADLYAVLQSTYGDGDGSTTFNLPDLRGRVIAGKDDMGGSNAARIGFREVASTTVATGNINNVQFTVASVTGIQVGHVVVGSGIPAGTTVSNISGTTLTLSVAVTTSNGDTLQFGYDGQYLGHATGAADHTLTAEQSGLPAHNHSANFPAYNSNGDVNNNADFVSHNDNHRTTVGHYQTVTVGNALAQNASESHNNMQPTFILNYIVKV